jgi:hypothetical protein
MANKVITMQQIRSIIQLLEKAKWYEYINDPTLADAILVRLTAGAHRIELKGESLRRKKVTDYTFHNFLEENTNRIYFFVYYIREN